MGALLREEREKKGLSHQQVSEMTRLRRHMIEALEDEAWDLLPPPVFVRGFVRSYTRALGLDEKKFLDLYDKIPPRESKALKLIPRPAKKKRGPLLLVIVLCLVVAGILYAWHGYSPKTGVPLPEEKKTLPLPEKETPVPAPEREKPRPEVKVGESEVRTKPAESPVQTKPVESPARAAVSEPPEKTEPPKDTMQREGETGLAAQSRALVEAPPVSPAGGEPFTLKGIVEERTWVKMSIDGAEAKEYIFQPGSRPQWKAWEGFEITVGNAGGITFELNGKEIATLGKMGQVVRMMLPEGYQGTGGVD